VPIAVLALVAVLVTGFLVPVRTSFSMSVASSGITPSEADRSFPHGAVVVFSWNTSDGGSVSFSVVDLVGHTLAHASGSSGNFTFTADGNPYGFRSFSLFYEVVNIHGEYTAPVLA